jgi:hypothetical protein
MSALALAAVLSFASQFDAPAAERAADVAYVEPGYCDGILVTADPATVHEQLEAPAGGFWWVPRFRDDGTSQLDPALDLALVDGNGTETDVDTTYLFPTSMVVAIPVPGDAVGGETYGLLSAGAATDLGVLRVSAETLAEATLTVDASVAGVTAPRACDLFCYDDTWSFPGAPTLLLSYTGGPAIVDVWAVSPEALTTPDLPRAVDTRLLPAVSESTDILLETEQPFRSGPIEVRFEIRDVGTRNVLAEGAPLLENDLLVPMSEIEGATDLPLCSDYNCFDCGGGTTTSCAGCGGPVYGDTLALLFAPALWLGLRRRRRRG